MYLVMGLIEEREVSIGGVNLGGKIKMSWADGMVGVMPVFDNKENAEKYAGKLNIIEVEESEDK